MITELNGGSLFRQTLYFLTGGRIMSISCAFRWCVASFMFRTVSSGYRWVLLVSNLQDFDCDVFDGRS